MSTTDRPLLGILLMCGFCVLAPISDALAKLLGGAVPLGMLLLVRFGAMVILMGPLALLAGASFRMDRRLWILTVARTATQFGGITFMFSGLRYLPLADAVAIGFVFPFILLLLGKIFLDEQVGPHRLMACAVGFIGTLCVIQPNFAIFGAPALLPAISAVFFALYILVTRAMAKDMDPQAVQAICGLQACAVLIPVLLWAPIPILSLIQTDGPTTLLLISLGIVGCFSHLFMSWSLRFAPSATLAPMQYLEIPVSALIGWLIWNSLPNGLAAVGISITIGAGLYIILRERAIAREERGTATP
jgi:drug/metabolite transporter (DMT)-like permease